MENNFPALDIELDTLGVVVAGAVDELTFLFLSDLHVVDIRVVFSEEGVDDFSFRGEDKDAFFRAGVDIAGLVDHDRAMG